MSTQHTWPEVAHYYLKSGISVLDTVSDREFILRGIYTRSKTGNGYFLEFENLGVWGQNGYGTWEMSWDQHTPILRALEDMTDDEVGELSELQGCKLWKHHPSSISTWTPAAFHWLITRGFDLFGLIASGQAIRKEAGV